jgi:D-alanyl-D-alanine carboxypeptidase
VDIKRHGKTVRDLWKIIVFVLVSSLFIAPYQAEAKRRAKHPYKCINYDITQNPRYASLIVNSATGEVLHKHNADLKRHPASLTKMMTVYIAFQAIKANKLSLNSQLPVSSWAALPSRSPTKLWLKSGQTISLRDALNAVIIHSANDASVVVAEAISGSEDAFAYKMTQTARQLGMKDTVFMNSHGLHHPEQVTTAFDMAKLGIALRRDFPEFYHMFSKKSFVFKGSVINGHNRVLSRYRWADGLKTGYIAASGFNLVTSATRPEGRIVAVVLGGQTAAVRDNHMISLLDRGFDRIVSGKPNSNEDMRYYAVNDETYYEDSGVINSTNAFEMAAVDTTQLSEQSERSKNVFDSVPSAILAEAPIKKSPQKIMLQRVDLQKRDKMVSAPSNSKKAIQASNKNKGKRVITPHSNKAKSSLIKTKVRKQKV